SRTPGTSAMALAIACTTAESRPSEKFGTHSITRMIIGIAQHAPQEDSRSGFVAGRIGLAQGSPAMDRPGPCDGGRQEDPDAGCVGGSGASKGHAGRPPDADCAEDLS